MHITLVLHCLHILEKQSCVNVLKVYVFNYLFQQHVLLGAIQELAIHHVRHVLLDNTTPQPLREHVQDVHHQQLPYQLVARHVLHVRYTY